MTEILGEEADIAECESCNISREIEKGVTCEGCGGFYCRHICWTEHWCGPLTDRNGNLVKVGDVVQYPDTNRIYRVVEATPSFIRTGICYGERIRRPENIRYILRPRLMKIVNPS